jgi:hypothetical protein
MAAMAALMQLHAHTHAASDVRAKLRDPAGGSQLRSDAEIVGRSTTPLLWGSVAYVIYPVA